MWAWVFGPRSVRTIGERVLEGRLSDLALSLFALVLSSTHLGVCLHACAISHSLALLLSHCVRCAAVPDALKALMATSVTKKKKRSKKKATGAAAAAAASGAGEESGDDE